MYSMENPDALDAILATDHSDSSIVEAANALKNLAANAANQHIIAQVPDIFRSLALMLKSPNEEVNVAAANALRNLATYPATQEAFAQVPDIFTELALLLKSPSEEVKVEATLALGNLAAKRANHANITREIPLLELFTNLASLLESPTEDVQLAAAHTLKSIADDLDNHRIIAKIPQISIIFGLLLNSHNAEVQTAGVNFLVSLIDDTYRAPRHLFEQIPDIYTTLVLLLNSYSTEIQAATAKILAHLAGTPNNQPVILQTPDILTRLAFLLGSDDENVLEHAISVLIRLTTDQANHDVILQTPDILARLAFLLRSDDLLIQELATNVFKCLTNNQANLGIIIAHTLDLLLDVAILMKSSVAQIQINALLILINLADNPNIRRMFVQIPDIFKDLADLFNSLSDEVKSNAAKLFGILINDLVNNSNSPAAAYALRELSNALAEIPEMSTGIALLLNSDDQEKQKEALDLLEGLIEEVENDHIILQIPNIFTRLAFLLESPNKGIKGGASSILVALTSLNDQQTVEQAQAVRANQQTIAQIPDIFTRLVSLLKTNIKQNIISILGHLIAELANPAITEAVATHTLRSLAAEPAAVAHVEDIFKNLATLIINSPNEEIKIEATSLLGSLAADPANHHSITAQIPDMSILTSLLESPNQKAQAVAAYVLGSLVFHPTIAPQTPRIFRHLLNALFAGLNVEIETAVTHTLRALADNPANRQTITQEPYISTHLSDLINSAHTSMGVKAVATYILGQHLTAKLTKPLISSAPVAPGYASLFHQPDQGGPAEPNIVPQGQPQAPAPAR